MSVLAIAALAFSFTLMLGMVAVLILLRRGAGPRYSASRQYDANRREAVRLLTGEAVDRVPTEQWYVRGLGEVTDDDSLVAAFRDAARAALEAVVPPDRGPDLGAGGARLMAEDALVIPAVSVADLRKILRHGEAARGLVIGLVLVNPEPPGGDARRVALPVQVLFPALAGAGREDLIRVFEDLRGRLGGG